MILSIILTVYNKEPFLRRALEALLNQEGAVDEDYEVLAVNDGSTDSSAIILEEYAQSYNRVRILTQQNQGLSMARNNGVDEALGEYVWFVDADDVIALNSVKLICEAVVSHPEVIPIYAKTEGIKKVRNAINPNVKTGKEVITYGRWEQCGVFYVFQKAFLKDNDLKFIPGIYHEDAEFTPRMLYKTNTVRVVPEILYTVYRDPISITQVPRSKRAFDYLTVAESLSKFVMENNEIGTPVGRIIDYYTAQDINNAFYIILQNSRKDQRRFNEVFFEKRKFMLRALRNAPKQKYKIEAFVFGVLPKLYVRVYKFMMLFCKEI